VDFPFVELARHYTNFGAEQMWLVLLN
jgi:hypothetical protein